MQRVGIATAVAMALAGPAEAGSKLSAFSDAELSQGFFATVFGLEHNGAMSGQVKKFQGPVRFEIVSRSRRDRTRDVAAFVKQLPKKIRGLDARIARPGETPNFIVVVVDRSAYVERVRADVFADPNAKVPGRCLVKADFGPRGIRRAVAVIVADEGEHLFQRCMTEEILQGLGPMNDDPGLTASVFNDRSRHSALTAFDRAIVSILYDPRLRHGMSKAEAAAVLPSVLGGVRQRIR